MPNDVTLEPMPIMIRLTLTPEHQRALAKRMKLRTLTKTTARAAVDSLVAEALQGVVDTGE